jgi:hypothetical protein
LCSTCQVEDVGPDLGVGNSGAARLLRKDERDEESRHRDYRTAIGSSCVSECTDTLKRSASSVRKASII